MTSRPTTTATPRPRPAGNPPSANPGTGRHPDANRLPVVRVAAAADLHLRADSSRGFRHAFREAARHADVLLLGGDLTASGTVNQARLVAKDVGNLGIPVAAVLGNHDHDSRATGKIIDVLTDAGVQVLEGTGTVVTCRGIRLGIAGCKGYGGGFDQAVVHEHGEPQTRAFVRHSRDSAKTLATALAALDCDVKVALTHYAPIAGTLAGEPRELYMMLGSQRLGQVIDDHRVALAIHGHAHRGTEKGVTPGGTPVRNVAYQVLGTAYRIYTLRQSSTDSTGWQVVGHDATRRR